jgi:predicted signal transduction protein with EAL and GGDEF domain
MLSVSIGIADLDAIERPTGEDLFEAADRALYAAKTTGRDRVEVADRKLVSPGVILLDEARARRGLSRA